ncbi:DUF2147 domain-containing protein [Dinoroseobacter sp. S124A]|uniref:DUF2147 domain-containing protein n=1 Tax=Dinoroseobacter sp. S124A TaxID=3415128 RepID=UPI003C7C3E49
MKSIFAILAACAALASPAAADAVKGVFQTAPNDEGNVGHVEFYECSGKICGKLLRSFTSNGTPIASDNIGKNIVWDMQNQGDGAYGKGKIWDPGADKTYRSKMSLDGDLLKVSGCVGPICRGNTWQRVR